MADYPIRLDISQPGGVKAAAPRKNTMADTATNAVARSVIGGPFGALLHPALATYAAMAGSGGEMPAVTQDAPRARTPGGVSAALANMQGYAALPEVQDAVSNNRYLQALGADPEKIPLAAYLKLQATRPAPGKPVPAKDAIMASAYQQIEAAAANSMAQAQEMPDSPAKAEAMQKVSADRLAALMQILGTTNLGQELQAARAASEDTE